MKPTTLGILAVTLAGMVWVGLSAQQEMQSRPGPGSGVMNVNVVNHPAVTAAQNGEWRVAIDNVPTVRLAAPARVSINVPEFVVKGRTYQVSWSDGTNETITVQEISEDGWIQISGRTRWVNLGTARAVEAR